MTLEVEKKSKLIQDFKVHTSDTGSAPVQIALLTARINELTEHFKAHKKDRISRRGLLRMVGKRSALLKYLHRAEPRKYAEVIQKLGLRK